MTGHDIREEFESHLAQRIQDNLTRGMSMDDARREAERRFGRVDRLTASCEKVEERRNSPWRGWRADVRSALSGLRRAPLHAALGVAIVAAGLSVTLATAILADGLLFHAPPGVRAGGDLRIVMNSIDGKWASFVPYETCVAMEEAVPDVALFCRGNQRVQVVAGGVAGVRGAELVTSGYFPGLGTRLVAGRAITRDDERSAAPVAVLGYRFAQSVFGEASSAVGRTVTVNGQEVAVIGVAEAGFRGQMSADPADLWVPVSLEPALAVPSILPDGRTVRGLVEGRMGWLMGVVRVTPDHSAESLRARLTPIVRGETPIRPEQAALTFDRAWLTPFSTDRDRLANVMQPLAAAVGLTLLLSAACLSSLFLGRQVSRRHELTIRQTLGASMPRLLRLVAAECLAIVAVGAFASVPLALGLIAAVGRLQLTAGIRVEDVATVFDGRAIGFAASFAAVVVLIAVPASLVMVRRLTRQSTAHGARLVSSGTSLRRTLMAAQVAIGCALLSGAGLLTRSIAALERQPLGFEAAGIGYLELEPAKSGLSASEQRALLERIRVETRGDRTIAAADFPPFGGDDSRIVYGVDSAIDRAVAMPAVRVIGSYFELLGIEVLSGQTLADRRPDERVVVISQPLAESFWPGQQPIGRELRMGGKDGPAYEVIGVVGGVRDRSLRGATYGRLYLPFDGDIETLALMRRLPHAGVAAGALVQQYRGADPRLIPVRSGALTDLIRRSLDQRLMFRLITSIVGLGSLFIVGVGVWGLAHGTVAGRWREFGLRLALGAGRGEVVRLAMKDALVVFALGGSAGLVAAWQFGRALESWLFGVTASDPMTLAAAALLVGVAVFAGNSRPARRASRLDPATLLRQE